MNYFSAMNWIMKRFLWALLSRPFIRAMRWTKDERDAFELFCRTSCGIKLFEFLRQVIASKTFNAVYRQSVSANAEARGAQDVLALLYRLRSFPFEESEEAVGNNEERTGLQGTGAKESDDWRWLGGPGAIG